MYNSTTNHQPPTTNLIASFFMLLFICFLASCSQTPIEESEIAPPDELETRMVECGPQGNCFPRQNIDYTIVLPGNCIVTVSLGVTRCTDPLGNLVVYFEDDEESIQTSGTCTITPKTVEALYQQAIEIQMSTYDLPECGSGNYTSSKQIKVNCVKLCTLPSLDGETISGYRLCTPEKSSCCIETINWCSDSNGDPEPTPVGNETYGSCPSTLTAPCPPSPFDLPFASPCISERCD